MDDSTTTYAATWTSIAPTNSSSVNLGDPIDPLSMTFYLAFFYAALAIICIFLIGRILRARHKLRSFQPAFLLLGMLWALIRAVQLQQNQLLLIKFFSRAVWGGAFDVIPTGLEFATMSLLCVYLVSVDMKTRSRERWSELRRSVGALFIASNAIVLALNATTFALSVTLFRELSELPNWILSLADGIAAAMWLFVVIFIALFGLRVAALLRSGDSRISMYLPKGLTRFKLLVVLCILALVLLSRCVVNIVFAFTNPGRFSVSNGDKFTNVIIFCLLLVWEVLPLSLVIVLFWNISPASPTSFSSHRVIESVNGPTTGNTPVHVHRESAGLLPFGEAESSVFSSHRRYDSDESDDDMLAKSPYTPYAFSLTPTKTRSPLHLQSKRNTNK